MSKGLELLSRRKRKESTDGYSPALLIMLAVSWFRLLPGHPKNPLYLLSCLNASLVSSLHYSPALPSLHVAVGSDGKCKVQVSCDWSRYFKAHSIFLQPKRRWGWNSFHLLLQFTTLALKHFFLPERETEIVSLRLWVICRIPLTLDSSSQSFVFPPRVAIPYSSEGTAVKGWTLECMVQQATALQPDLHKLPCLLVSVGCMCLILTIMSSNCFIFTQSGYQPGSDLTACAVIYIWILIMLNILYWLLILENLQRTGPALQAKGKIMFFKTHCQHLSESQQSST